MRALNGSRRLVAEDTEPDVRGERLELLTVVRGLEALEQPSRVTVMTPSTYIREGIRHGILQWRESGWLWEFFGQMVPVKNTDLWQRVDHALGFHEVECRVWRTDPAHGRTQIPGNSRHRPESPRMPLVGTNQPARQRLKTDPVACRSLIATGFQRWKQQLLETWAALVSCPWFG